MLASAVSICRFALCTVAVLSGLSGLSGCGGEAREAPPDALAASQSIADRAARRASLALQSDRLLARLHAGSADRRQALAAPTPAQAAEQMFAFGERSFPQYFPGTRATQSSGGLLYRYYPQTSTYFVVDGAGQVYVLGGAFGGQLLHVGTVQDFLGTVSGTVSGLLSAGLVLQVGSQTLAVDAGSTSFAFPTLVPAGTAYTVSVRTQPAGLSCSVFNGSGVAGAGTPSVATVACSVSGDPLAPPAPVSYGDAATVYAIDPSGYSEAPGGDGGDGDGGAAGAAGDGAPLVRARVSLIDADGQTVSGYTDQNGRYLLRLRTATFKAPYVLKVVDGLGNVKSSLVAEPIKPNSVVWTNVNHVTDKIVSDLLKPEIGGTDKSFAGKDLDTTRLPAAVAGARASMRAALGAAGITKTDRFDPTASRFALDGSGVDAVLDAVGHTREPRTGATQLTSRLTPVSASSAGTEVPRLITDTAPLDPALVPLPGSPALTYAKLQAWTQEFNRCLALTAAQYLQDAACLDSRGTQLVESQYRHNSKDFREHLRSLFSEANGAPVAGSNLRNPSLLFVGRSGSSTTDDLAYVQFSVTQPYIGPKGPNGPVSGSVEYPVVIVFRRGQGLTEAKAGNWLAYGNQLVYDLSIEPRYTVSVQANPQYQSTPLTYAVSSLRLLAITKQWNRTTQSYTDPGLRAVRVTGPGLPSTGVVLSPGAVCGTATYLPILNKSGAVPAGIEKANRVQNDFRLAATNLQGQRFVTPGSYFITREIVINQIPYLADFSPIRPFSVYKFEVFLARSTSTTTPDAVEFVRILAPLAPPELVVRMPMNDPSLSLGLITAGAPAIPMGSSVAVNWTNNRQAAPVSRVGLYGEEVVTTGGSSFLTGYTVQAFVPGAYSTRSVPSAQLLTVPTSVDEPNCVAARLPAMDGVVGRYREVTLVWLQANARVYRSLSWSY